MALTKYEFLNELQLQNKVVGDEKEELLGLRGIFTLEDESKRLEKVKEADEEIRKLSDAQDESGVKRTGTLGRVWLIRRLRDAQLFLAREFEDPERILEVTGKAMLRLLNHPNLVSLVDIVREAQPDRGFDYMVWEYCSRGTLSRYLTMRSKDGGYVAPVPESLCWHVLEGISAALCWLHHGVKVTFPFDREMQHDPDWHTILIGDIHPSNIFFCSPRPGEERGQVKLGCFTSSRVCLNPGPKEGPPEFNYGRSLYWALEIIQGRELWNAPAEIWSLGAVIWKIMTGKPPQLREVKRGAETVLEYDCNTLSLLGYSMATRDVLHTLLHPDPASRATAMELVHKVARAKIIVERRLQAGTDDEKLVRASKQGGLPKIFGDAGSMFAET